MQSRRALLGKSAGDWEILRLNPAEAFTLANVVAVSTIALTVAWLLRIPHRMWAAHPVLADLFLGIFLCALLQVLWTDPEPSKKE